MGELASDIWGGAEGEAPPTRTEMASTKGKCMSPPLVSILYSILIDQTWPSIISEVTLVPQPSLSAVATPGTLEGATGSEL